MTRNNEVNRSAVSQGSPPLVSDPLTGQQLVPGAPPLAPSSVPATSFPQILAQEEREATKGGEFQQRLAAMGDEEIRRLRIEIAGEIKSHVMKGDRTQLKDAQERFNGCTKELRRRAGVFEEIPSVAVSPGTPPPPASPIPAPFPPSPPPPPAVTVPGLTPLPPQGNTAPPLLYQSFPYGLPPGPAGLITPESLYDPQRLTQPLPLQGLQQLQQWNAQQLQMLQYQLQQGTLGMPDLYGNSSGGQPNKNPFSF